MEQDTFYMVWSPQGGAPTHKHAALFGAVHEAERLARNNAGKEFYILQAIEGRVVNDMQRVKLDLTPF
ncbi:MAG: hypothetical protein I8H71_01375 [Xanthomonadaceae bacterium]|nr:hypothetical protein [Xanthomonadaceae bacterium]